MDLHSHCPVRSCCSPSLTPISSGNVRRHIKPRAVRPDLHSQAAGSNDHSPKSRFNVDGDGLRKALVATACVFALTTPLVAGVAPAQASDRVWKPRRHNRKIGERYEDSWADAIAEVSETEARILKLCCQDGVQLLRLSTWHTKRRMTG